MPRLRSGAGVLLVLGIALAGCGSGGTSQQAGAPTGPPLKGADPKAWVGVFCDGIGAVAAGGSILQQQQTTSQSQKDTLIRFIDSTQQAMNTAAAKLLHLGPPAITGGQQVQNTAVNFFATGAQKVAAPRDQLSALDANAPDFYAKVNALPAPDLQSVAAQAQALLGNRALEPYRLASPECQRVGAASRQGP
ncbi:MAG: hypothetical protein ACRDSP_20825 [Pseudonocardiaceae bacterium]